MQELRLRLLRGRNPLRNTYLIGKMLLFFKILEYRNCFINKRANLLTDIVLSNIVEMFMNDTSEPNGAKRAKVRDEITVFRGTYRFFFHCCVEADQINLFNLRLYFADIKLISNFYC